MTTTGNNSITAGFHSPAITGDAGFGDDIFRSIFTSAPVGIGIVKDRCIIEVNDMICAMTGYARNELAGKNSRLLYPTDEDYEHVGREKNRQVLKTGNARIESRWRRKDGSTIDVLLASTAIDRNNPDLGFTISAFDITDHIEFKRALEASEERYRNLFELAVDGILLGSRENIIIIDVNQGMEHITGQPKSLLKGKRLEDLFTHAVLEKTPLQKDLLLKGETVVNEREITRPDGSTIVVETRSKMISGHSFLSIFHDITGSRKKIENMQRTLKLESLATLAGGIAHDYNNILAGISGYIDLARRPGISSDERDSFLDRAMMTFGRAKNLTSRLTTFASGGAPILRREEISRLLMEYTYAAMTGSAIKYRFDIENGLWDCIMDSSQIGQVIYAIVTNAREFSPAGGEILISASNTVIESNPGHNASPGRYVMVSVADMGEGIAPEVLKHVFDPFFTTKNTGNGLGLSTSYSIIKRHKGLIDVESVPGKGCTVCFHIPAAGNHAASPAAVHHEPHKGSGLVLVMDDEQFIREITSEMLRDMGYSVVTAQGGREALEILSAHEKPADFRFLLLDLTIPGGMGGVETVAAVRKMYPEIPVFAASGYSNDPVMANPARFGFAGSIRKPFRINDLSDFLNSHIG